MTVTELGVAATLSASPRASPSGTMYLIASVSLTAPVQVPSVSPGHPPRTPQTAAALSPSFTKLPAFKLTVTAAMLVVTAPVVVAMRFAVPETGSSNSRTEIWLDYIVEKLAWKHNVTLVANAVFLKSKRGGLTENTCTML